MTAAIRRKIRAEKVYCWRELARDRAVNQRKFIALTCPVPQACTYHILTPDKPAT
ncbi:hypothetical protein PSCICE_46240 [Pseudomonas cichorii]|nr:hypothetical protein PSCICE_46240 [Pseudomonas cichorii]